uniref:Uncharacterized protein n=1 Tax=Salix viminalis TaxID=40686 RepID=A0A6N2L456_SALVM
MEAIALSLRSKKISMVSLLAVHP